MGVLRGKLPHMVYELSDDQVERWREGDETVWAERTPGLLDRLIRPGVQVIRDPGCLAELQAHARAGRQAARDADFEAEAG